jgi:hypothetical protein
MDELRDRFAALDRIPVPHLWSEIDRRATDAAAVSPVDGQVTWRAQRAPHRLSPMLILLMLSLLLALALGLVTVGSRLPNLWTSVLPPPAEAYDAVLVRGAGEPELQVLLARDGATQRVVGVPVSRFGEVIPQVLEASASGWIALYAVDVPEATTHNEYVVLLDVRDAHPPIVRIGTHLGAWTNDGRYWSATNDAYELIDPNSGNVVSLPRGVSADLDWWGTGYGRMSVAADGPGLLLGDADAVYGEDGLPYPQKWGVLSPEGSLARGLPDLAEGVGTRRISARWGLLQRCGNGTSGYICPGLGTGAIVSGPASDGSYRQWGADPPAHDFVIDESWAVDGGLWLLVDRRSDGRTIVLIHRDEDNVDREIASFVVDPDEHVRIGDLAPDDSLIALELSGKFPVVQTVIVETGTGRSHLFDGALGGFVAAAATAGWVAGEGGTEAGQLLARPAEGGESGLGYGPLPSVEDQVLSLSAERVLLVHEVEATSSDPGATTRLTLGPVELEEGIGISLACSGPGEITVTEVAPDGPEWPYTYVCLDPSSYEVHEGPNVRWESASVQVEYDRSVRWRLVIFDPLPRNPRP